MVFQYKNNGSFSSDHLVNKLDLGRMSHVYPVASQTLTLHCEATAVHSHKREKPGLGNQPPKSVRDKVALNPRP